MFREVLGVPLMILGIVLAIIGMFGMGPDRTELAWDTWDIMTFAGIVTLAIGVWIAVRD